MSPVIEKRPFSRLILSCSLIIASLGVLTIAGWITHTEILTNFHSGYVSMAPSTAVLFILFSIVLIQIREKHLSAGKRKVIIGLCLAGLVTACILLISSSFRIYFDIEKLGLTIEKSGIRPTAGHMSPVTALCFVLTGLIILSSLNMRLLKTVFILICFQALITFFFLLAYCIGDPLINASIFIPPALTTLLAFFLLLIILFAMAGPVIWAEREKLRKPTSDSFVYIVLFFLLTGGVIIIGYIYNNNYEKKIRNEVEQQLSTISNLKVSEITRFRNECLSTARVFYKNPDFSDLVERCNVNSGDVEARKKLKIWISRIQANYQYDKVVLLNLHGIETVTHSDTSVPVSSYVKIQIPSIIRSKQIAFIDFHRNEYNHKIYIAILIPVLDISKNDKVLGILDFRIDPEKFLYPYVTSWPTLSKTAETYLVRKDSNDALFLNELRFKKDAALSLKISLKDTNVPAVKAVLGRTGIVEGTDYRGIHVLADIHTVPGSPWYMVAKIDKEEVFKTLGEQLWINIILVFMLILGIGLGLVFIWRQQRARFYRERYLASQLRLENDKKLKESEYLYRSLFENMLNGFAHCQMIFNHDKPIDFIYLNVNNAFETLTGLKNVEGKKVSEVIPGIRETDPELLERYGRVARTGIPETFEIYVEAMAMWFSVSVYSLHEGHFVAVFDVITKRKQAEEALLESQEKYYYLFENAPVGMYHTKIDGSKILEINNTACEMLGFTKDELLGQQSAIRWADPDRRVEILNIMNQNGYAKNFDADIIKKDGSRISCLLSMNMHKEQGYIEGFIVDISERKKLEESIKESEIKFSAVFENNPVTVVLTSAVDNTFIDVNKTFINDMGYTREEVVGKTAFELDMFYNGYERQQYLEDLNNNGSVFGMIVQFKSKQEKILAGMISTTRIMIKGKPCWLSTIIDVSEKHKMEKALFESKELYKNLFNNSQVGLFRTAIADGKILGCNQTFAEMSGYDSVADCCREYVTSEHYLDPKARDQVVGQLFREGVVKNFQTSISDRNGTPRWVSYSVKIFKEDGFIEGAVLDITDKKKLEDDINKLVADLKFKNAELERYTYTVSHDLKAPLITIKGFAGMLEMDLENLDKDKVKKDLARISTAADKMKELLDDLLALSRVGRLYDKNIQINLPALISEVIETVRFKMEGNKISITVAEELPVIYGDRIRIGEVYQNLIDNAIKYASKEHMLVINIGCKTVNQEKIIFIKDNGIGIEQKYLERIFNLFEKIDPATEGTGVGLAIVKRIIEFQGGRVWIESEGLGKGTTVFLTHPEVI